VNRCSRRPARSAQSSRHALEPSRYACATNRGFPLTTHQSFMLGVLSGRRKLISIQEKSEIRFLPLGARRLCPARAHDPTTLAEGGVPRLAAAHANLQKRVPVTAVADACAVFSVRKPHLRSAPVAAHPLHRRVIGSQHIQQSAQRQRSDRRTGGQRSSLSFQVRQQVTYMAG